MGLSQPGFRAWALCHGASYLGHRHCSLGYCAQFKDWKQTPVPFSRVFFSHNKYLLRACYQETGSVVNTQDTWSLPGWGFSLNPLARQLAIWFPSKLQLHWWTEWLPWWLSSKESVCNAGDTGSIPGSERSPGEGQPTRVFLPEDGLNILVSLIALHREGRAWPVKESGCNNTPLTPEVLNSI